MIIKCNYYDSMYQFYHKIANEQFELGNKTKIKDSANFYYNIGNRIEYMGRNYQSKADEVRFKINQIEREKYLQQCLH